MIYRIYPQADTFITNFPYQGVQQTGSNFGASEILHLFKVAAISGAVGPYSSASYGRVLMKFDVSDFAGLTGSHQAPATGIVYRLHLSDARHDQTLPTSYDVEIQGVSQGWDEGSGSDVDHFFDTGYANWTKARSNSSWTVAGASGSGPTSVFHFDGGHEDLDADVTSIVNGWLTGSVTNNGFLIKLSSSLETNGIDYFVKMFHGRETFFSDRRPYIEAQWDDSLKDDRNNFVFDNTGSLFLYNRVRGQFTDIPTIGTGSIYVKVMDLSGTLLVLTGSHSGQTGIYSATFVLPTSSYSGSLFSDAWFSGSRAYMTATFVPSDTFSQPSAAPNVYFVAVTNLKNQYDQSESPRLNVFIRNRDYNPAVVATASSDANGLVMTKAYYRIENDLTEAVLVPFGTGTVETTRLSYDQRGNYFKFYMRSLPPGNIYRLVFLFNVDGQQQLIDDDFKFRVV